jgi:YMGG-like Gly-zipper
MNSGALKEDYRMTSIMSLQKWCATAKLRVFAVIVGLSLLGMGITACGTVTGAAVGAGSGAAIGAAAGDTKKGALIGAGVGAAGGAIYDATR